MLAKDADYFYELQTQTGWSRTLQSFAEWCAPEPDWLTLDVGCGPGLLPMVFSRLGCQAVGVDLDIQMFIPSTLHSTVSVGDVYALPFQSSTFDLITATNLLFLTPQPVQALIEMKRVLKTGGKMALLNPSENLNVRAAKNFAKERGLDGTAQDTFLNWAKRAENNHRWNEDETRELYAEAGLKYMASTLKVGPGFGRFSWGTA